MPEGEENNGGEQRCEVKEERVEDGKRHKHEMSSLPFKNNKRSKELIVCVNFTKQKLYCICKSAESKRFMIAYENRDEWYHGDCVGVTQSLSNKIKTFFCHLCRNEKSSCKKGTKQISKVHARSAVYECQGVDAERKRLVIQQVSKRNAIANQKRERASC
jgi:hypothetical protein